MTVLKRHQIAPALGGAVVMELADLKAEGERLLAHAQAESARLLRETRGEVARLRVEAVEAGREEGLAAGRAEGIELGRAAGEAAAIAEVKSAYAAQLDELLRRWEAALGRWESAREELLRDARRETLRLAIAIAERIVRRAVEAKPELAVDRLEGALELLGRASAATIVCDASTRRLLEGDLPALVERLERTIDLSFVEDAALEPGDVLVRVPEGAVDASLAAQLDRITEAILPGERRRSDA